MASANPLLLGKKGLIKQWLYLLGQKVLISSHNLRNFPGGGVIQWYGQDVPKMLSEIGMTCQ